MLRFYFLIYSSFFQVGMAKAELKLTSLGFWRGYSSANRAGTYTELVAVAPIFKALMHESLVRVSHISSIS